MKILVLGASGFLGMYLGFALQSAGHRAIGVTRTTVSPFAESRVIRSTDDVEREIRSDSWDAVINCIAMASHEACEQNPREAENVNVKLPGIWARAARDVGAQFLHVSTDAVFDGQSDSLYREEDAPQPRSTYGRTKLNGEYEVQNHNSDALITRVNFFGWSRDRKAGILDFFVSALEEGRLVTGFQDYVVSSLYVADLVDAWLGLLSLRSKGLFHVVASTPQSKFEFAVQVAQELGLSEDFIQPGFMTDVPNMVSRGHNLGLSTARVELSLGRPMPTTREGIARAILERDAVHKYFSRAPAV